MNEKKYVPLGRVLDAHGLKGEVKVRLFNPSSSTLRAGLRVILIKNNSIIYQDRIEKVNVKKGEAIVKFASFSDRNAGESVKGAEICVKVEDLPPLEEDEYYWVDLLGCRVEEASGKLVGVVEEIIPTGGADVLVVRNSEGEELMVPFVNIYVDDVDVHRKVIKIRDAEILKF